MHVDPPFCACGHPWEEHHHGCIMNPNFPSEAHIYGICSGMSAEECEWTQVNGDRIREEEPECHCGSYKNANTGLSGWQSEGVKDES